MSRRILLTGASGYVGGRLLPVLEEAGYAVRCLARQPEFLAARRSPRTEVVRGDVLQPATLGGALAGIDTAFYLVHSMGAARGFVDADRGGARHFGAAAAAAGVRRIIYLGGLGEDGEALSDHLRSRHEVGDLLRAAGVPVIEFRASIIIGSGSLSFEMVRALTEHLPVMIMPRWVRVLSQPIGIQDLLAYLVRRLLENGANSSFVSVAADPTVPVESILKRPQAWIVSPQQARHPKIPLPRDLYRPARVNSAGIEFGDRAALTALLAISMARQDLAPAAGAVRGEPDAIAARMFAMSGGGGWWLLFIAVGVTLLVAVVGAVLLAKRRLDTPADAPAEEGAHGH